jgi:isochorismate synthase
MTGTDLHARTVPLEFGPDALQFDSSPTVLFDRPGLTLVGWGTARLVRASEATEVLAAIPCTDEVRRTGSGVVALGALPFDNAMEGSLIVPRFTMGIGRDADGATHRWATAVGSGDEPPPTTEELFDSVIWQYGAGTEGSAGPDAHVVSLDTPMPTEKHVAMVRRTVAALAEPGTPLRKLVLSRTITAHLDGPLPLSSVLRRLRAHEPNCTVFSLPVPEGTFFGASPELLVARSGDRVVCHPLAGTVARGDTARADADAQGRLVASAKDQMEHRYVVDGIEAMLRPLCSELTVPAAPTLITFRAVAHLGTRIEGRLRAATPVLELLELLHPTPAVGGTPRALALQAIAEAEPVRRGYWAGPIGWVDGHGDGEWMIGIRSARLHPDAHTVTLHAGGGIVADSDPEAEAVEVNVKLASVLDSVVPGGSVHLR